MPELMATPPQRVGAGISYLIYVAGIVHYGVRPLAPKAPLRQRVGAGHLLASSATQPGP
ncbi:MAG: hypothetical protein WBX27_21600 [Specibacter sp.]